MDEELSISLVIILIIGGLMITALLTCYACIFRDLCCQRVDRAKRRRVCRSPGGSGELGQNRHDMIHMNNMIQLNDITQGESMPTETENI
ncbi:uncharacterized protein LOC141524490 [Cotesia typhae]|uniref:uncharacterized protein LOC141524490 n=1 Tax=Cotesia typhae TaxID=2053667 RepID=UPI003D68C29D